MNVYIGHTRCSFCRLMLLSQLRPRERVCSLISLQHYSGCNVGSIAMVFLLARYLTNQWMEFHQTSVDGVVEDTDELFRFRMSRDHSVGPTLHSYV